MDDWRCDFSGWGRSRELALPRSEDIGAATKEINTMCRTLQRLQLHAAMWRFIFSLHFDDIVDAQGDPIDG